jgi:site-specific recombinase XerD
LTRRKRRRRRKKDMLRPNTSAAGPAAQLVDGFIGHLRRERGVSGVTVEAYVSDVRRFLADRADSDLSRLTAAGASHSS